MKYNSGRDKMFILPRIIYEYGGDFRKNQSISEKKVG